MKNGKLNYCRSDLSLIIGDHVEHDESIKSFFKGIYRLRPPRPKYDMTWDISLVLYVIEKLYPNKSQSLETIFEKLVTLLGIAFNSTLFNLVQTFSKINIENITSSVSEKKMTLNLTSRIFSIDIDFTFP